MNYICLQRLEVLEHEEIKAGERAQLKIFEQLRELRRVLQLEKEARIAEEDKVFPHTTTCVLILLYIYVLILLSACSHTII